MLGLRMVRELIAVKYEERESVSAGGISLIQEETGPVYAEVLGCGPEVEGINTGDVVLIPQNCGSKVQTPEGEIHIMEQTAVFAVKEL